MMYLCILMEGNIEVVLAPKLALSRTFGKGYSPEALTLKLEMFQCQHLVGLNIEILHIDPL